MTRISTVSILLVLALAPGAPAQEPTVPDGVVTVGTRIAAPFVMSGPDGYSGLTVALWERIADRLDVDYVFQERDIEGLLAGVQDGSLFAAAAALTITADREARVDFTHPFFTTGLGIAVPHRPAGFIEAVFRLFSLDFLWAFALLGAVLLFWGGLVWHFERVENAEQFGGPAARGIGNGFWWAAVTMTTVGYGDKAPRTVGGRIVGFLWMFTAIIVISFFTAAIASSLTVTQLDSRVGGPEDLPRARVGSLEGSAATLYLTDDGIATRGFASIEAGLEAVAADELDAFVHDAPILLYQSQGAFHGRTRVLASTFQEQGYGIALPTGSDLRERVNAVLLEFVASDDWVDLRRRYLGER